jgi:hypothetical protein
MGRARVLAFAVVAAALAGGVVLASSALAPRQPELGRFRGARLGMTASAVRARFETPSLGSWDTKPSTAADDAALEWHASKGPEEARFEFHSGMLVAVRARVGSDDPAAARAPVEASSMVVRSHGEADGGVVGVTILARDCPTHHDEAERLARRATKR